MAWQLRAAVHGIRGAVLLTALASVAATVVIWRLPLLHSAGRWPALQVALETAASLSGLLAAFLVVGRLRRRTLLNELMLACALAVLALSGLLFVTVPVLRAAGHPQLTLWAALAGSLLGAVLFCLAAFVPRRRLQRPGPLLAAGAAGLAGLLALGAVGIREFAGHLPLRLPAAQAPDLHAQVVPAVQLVMVVLYGLAAAGFLSRSHQLGDEFLGWLSIAAVLSVVSRVNYFLYPALDTESAYAGEAFRLAFYGVLLAGSVREIWSYWRALSEAAVLEERRRIARDLHDGLAQELAYLARNLELLDPGADPAAVGRLRQAVERAQLESRGAIRALAAPAGEALDVALTEAASEIADRFGVEPDFDLAPGARLSPARAEALLRIACQAVTNAARHSGAHRVSISLSRDGEHIRLRVSDAGCGFEATAAGSGFGLISMRERAQSVGGELRISSVPGKGSEVEAVL